MTDVAAGNVVSLNIVMKRMTKNCCYYCCLAESLALVVLSGIKAILIWFYTDP